MIYLSVAKCGGGGGGGGGGGKALSNKYLRLCVALPWLSVDVSVCGFISPLKKCFILRAKLIKIYK